eukprot:3395722-Prymnesium_polylepis.1
MCIRDSGALGRAVALGRRRRATTDRAPPGGQATRHALPTAASRGGGDVEHPLPHRRLAHGAAVYGGHARLRA